MTGEWFYADSACVLASGHSVATAGSQQGWSGSTMLNRSFWKGRHVLLTGHTGFRNWLLSGCMPWSRCDRIRLEPPTQPSLFEQAKVAGAVRSSAGHTRLHTAQDCGGRVLSQCDHSHGCTIRRASWLRGSHRNYSSNVMEPSTSSSAAAARHPCVVVNVTSDKCYENASGLGYPKTSPGGRDPYSNQKAGGAGDHGLPESFFPPASLARHGVALRAHAPETLWVAAIGRVTSLFPTS